MHVDPENKTAMVTNLTDEKAVWPILAPNERHYNGLEKRLQVFMQNKKPLPDLIADIKVNGIHVDYHANLSIYVGLAEKPKLMLDELQFLGQDLGQDDQNL